MMVSFDRFVPDAKSKDPWLLLGQEEEGGWQSNCYDHRKSASTHAPRLEQARRWRALNLAPLFLPSLALPCLPHATASDSKEIKSCYSQSTMSDVGPCEFGLG